MLEYYNFYNKRLSIYADANRRKMTKAEACLWKYTLSGKKTGYQFRRQRPVLQYIADFMCQDLMLIIEVDGLTHQWESVSENDIIRQRRLETAGFTVIRFEDNDVLQHINNVNMKISDTIQVLTQKIETAFLPHCYATPPPEGDSNTPT